MRSLAIYFVSAKLAQRTAKKCKITIFNYIFNICMAFNNQYLIDFFKQRMVEAYDRNTLDSYSVRTCNTMSMLYELKGILKGWIIGNVKRGNTVALCVEEFLKLLKMDEWIDCSFYNKDKLEKKFTEYQKEVAAIKENKDKKEKDNLEAKYMLHLVTSCITQNEKPYLTTLIAAIQSDLLSGNTYQDHEFHDVMERLDRKVSLMATELLRRGYSNQFLYFYFKSLKRNAAGIPFGTAYSRLQANLGVAIKQRYDVILRLNFQGNVIPAMADMVEEVPAEILDAMDEPQKAYSKRDQRRRFYMIKVDATDSYSAIEESRVRLFQALDRNDIGLVQISDVGIASLIKNGTRAFFIEKHNNKRRTRNAGRLATVMNDIDRADHILPEIEDRLNTALRHLRVGDEQSEMEQRFLNYWIGLEFIFATPKSGDSTFLRVMEKFPKIKALYYLKRNVADLDSRLREKGLIGATDSFGNMTEPQMDTAFNAATDILLKYRISNMKSHLHDHEKVKKYLDKHTKNLVWHLSRIYHLRNELVHEAAIRQNIEGVTNNLRSYLVFMLNLLLDYCKLQLQNPQGEGVTMDNFFWYYELLWLKYTPEYQKDGFLSLDVPEELVK